MKSERIFSDPSRQDDSYLGANRDETRQPQRQCLRRVARFSSWIGPGVVLTLMPKCPACVAAYIALGTGVGLSVPAAGILRTSLIFLSAGSLGFLVFRSAVIFLRRHRAAQL
jgi:hypothetical protein